MLRMAFRFCSRFLYDSSKLKYWNIRLFYATGLSVTGFLGRRMCTQTFVKASRQDRSCLIGSRICFKRGLSTRNDVSIKEKRTDLMRLFNLARPEALRITGMVSYRIL